MIGQYVSQLNHFLQYNENLFHDLVFIPICAGHDAAFRHQSMRILCLRVHASCYSLR
jgi:hypothetical protein